MSQVWCQLLGNSLPESFGLYVFDPWLLKLAKIYQKLWIIKDYASDAIVLQLASSDMVQKLIALEES